MSGGESGSTVTVHDEPAAGKSDDDNWKQRVLEEVARILTQELDSLDPRTPEQATLMNLELAVQAAMRRVSRPLVECLVQRGIAEFGRDRPNCPRCQRLMEVAHGARSRRLVGLTGTFQVVRPEYRCRRCSEHEAPADRLLGLGPGLFSPALSRVIAREGAEVPSFERAAHNVGDTLGIPLEPMTVERTAEALGHVAMQEMQEKMAALEPVESLGDSTGESTAQPALPDDAPTWLVGADGGRVHAGGEWREVKIGVACRLGPQLELRDDKIRLALGPRVYAAGLEDADRFFDRLSVCVNAVRGEGKSPAGSCSWAMAGHGSGSARALWRGGRTKWSRSSISTTLGSICTRWPGRSFGMRARRTPGRQRWAKRWRPRGPSRCSRPSGPSPPEARSSVTRCKRRSTPSRPMRFGWTTRPMPSIIGRSAQASSSRPVDLSTGVEPADEGTGHALK